MKASDFAAAVLYSEGLDLNYSEFRPRIEEAFIARYGKSASSRHFGQT
jgi:hypothetical protein